VTEFADGVILSGTGGVWNVRLSRGDVVEASLRGRLKKSDGGLRADGSIRRDTIAAAGARLKLAVGDDVQLERETENDAWAIGEIQPRRSQLARRAPGGGFGQRVIVANVDQVVVVFAAAKPEPHARMLDRFLVIAEANGIAARIVINKVELVDAEAVRQRFQAYERAGYPLHFTSVKTGAGLEELRPVLSGRRSVFTGPSGVGKSSLLNALFPGASLRVGEISESVNKGRHTTVGARMLPLPEERGGFAIDTPGLREIGLWDLAVEHLDACFPEVAALEHACQFTDCRHATEPGCTVRAAVARGDFSRDRYESYLHLLEELHEGARS
jgi:ribosome biogenesis GTPase